ncbi:MAG: hypothetical protein ACOCRX_03140 [Candidatus Woesearchaeota archaeon]
MIALRYSHNYYIYKGYFNKDIFMYLIKNGVKYIDNVFYFPIILKDYMEKNLNLRCIENSVDYLYYGEKDEQIKNKAILYSEEANGQYFYILKEKIDDLQLVKNVPFYYMNKPEIESFEKKLKNSLYLIDYITNTSISIKNNDLLNLLIGKDNMLYLHNTVNRMLLQDYSFN